jgi:DNA-binding transcriptional regulator YhcF (GntR family)
MTTRDTLQMKNRRGINYCTANKTYRWLERHKSITSRHEQEEEKTTNHDDLGYCKEYRIGKIKNIMSLEQRYRLELQKQTS